MRASLPTVTVAVPVLNEEASIAACLDSICAQTYPAIVEILVIDGGSDDQTRVIASHYSLVRVLDNPARIQASALNNALREARGEVFVRVDGHATIAMDYVEACVRSLQATGASMVGGGMTPVGVSPTERGIAAALTSRFGAGPARFHRDGPPGWVDTVYLGAYWTADALSLGGYREVRTNEDAELAHRMARRAGVWFDPTIRSSYTPRGSLQALGAQFFRYGQGRAATLVRHPTSVAPRQLAPAALLVGLLSPWRRSVIALYVSGLVAAAALAQRRDPRTFRVMLAAVPTMHAAWLVGFVVGLFRREVPPVPLEPGQ